jgi:hypothetical protein
MFITRSGLLVYIEVQCLIYYSKCNFYQLWKEKLHVMVKWKLSISCFVCVRSLCVFGIHETWCLFGLIEWSVSIMILPAFLLFISPRFLIDGNAVKVTIYRLTEIISFYFCEIIWHNFHIVFVSVSNWQFC